MSRYYIVDKIFIGTQLDHCDVLSEATTLKRAEDLLSTYRKELLKKPHNPHQIAIMQFVG